MRWALVGEHAFKGLIVGLLASFGVNLPGVFLPVPEGLKINIGIALGAGIISGLLNLWKHRYTEIQVPGPTVAQTIEDIQATNDFYRRLTD